MRNINCDAGNYKLTNNKFNKYSALLFESDIYPRIIRKELIKKVTTSLFFKDMV